MNSNVTQPFKRKLYDAAQTKLQWLLYAGCTRTHKQKPNLANLAVYETFSAFFLKKNCEILHFNCELIPRCNLASWKIWNTSFFISTNKVGAFCSVKYAFYRHNIIQIINKFNTPWQTVIYFCLLPGLAHLFVIITPVDLNINIHLYFCSDFRNTRKQYIVA